MKNSCIKQSSIGKYTCLDFPKRKARLVYDRETKQYRIYNYADWQVKKVKEVEASESPIWKSATLVTSGICIGILTVLGLMLFR